MTVFKNLTQRCQNTTTSDKDKHQIKPFQYVCPLCVLLLVLTPDDLVKSSSESRPTVPTDLSEAGAHFALSVTGRRSEYLWLTTFETFAAALGICTPSPSWTPALCIIQKVVCLQLTAKLSESVDPLQLSVHKGRALPSCCGRAQSDKSSLSRY